MRQLRERHGAQRIALHDQERLRRLFDRSLGAGFKLAIIEAATPAARWLIWRWVCGLAKGLGGRCIEFDLSALGGARRFNFWDTLIERLDPEAQPDRKLVLGIWGVEEVIYEEEDRARARWLEQLNAQRDLFVRDLPYFWVLFIHPRTRHALKNTAPDFCDFASIWAEAALPDVPASLEVPGARVTPRPTPEPATGMAPRHTLRILHLSDLHEGQPGRETLWRRRRVLGDAWLRNLGVIAGSGRGVDLVCFTGDVAYAGRPEEYVRAADFVRELLRRLGLGSERFFAVPGNHDVDRAVHADAWRALREQIEPRDAEALSAWLAGEKPPRGIAAEAREQVLARGAAFRRWLHDLGREDLLPERSPHGRLGYRRTLDLPGLPFPMQVIGLDTAWLAGDEADAKRLRLTDGQVMALATDEHGDPLPGFRLGLWHHPLDELADGTDTRRLLAERIDLGLRGHLHEAEPSVWTDPDRMLREFAAGCLYESDRFPNFCQVIDATLDAAGRPLCYALWFRSWSPRGHWFSDDSLYRDSTGGRLTVIVRSTPLEETPTVPVGGVFVGRKNELSGIEAALLPPSGPARAVAVCAVQGMPGVGKSYLAEHFVQLHRDRFPGGVARIALGPSDARGAAQLAAELCDRLKLPGGGDPWAALRGRLLEPRTLSLIENADDAPLGHTVAEFVRRLPGCPILVTGRLKDLGGTAGWRQVHVQTLEIDDGLDQLRGELGDAAAGFADADLRALVQALGGLPLAIHLAAGYLRGGATPGGFLGRLRASGLALGPFDPADPRWADRARTVLKTSFDLSLEALSQALAGDLTGLGSVTAAVFNSGFRALGHAPLAGFGRGLGAAIAGLTVEAYERLVLHARRLSLLEPVADPERRGPAERLHPLLAEHLRAGADGTAVLDRMTNWFVSHMREREDPDAQGAARREVQWELAGLLDWLERVPVEAIGRLVGPAMGYAILHGPFYAWARFCERGLAATTDPTQRSSVLWVLGQCAIQSGNLDRALTVAREKATLNEKHGAHRELALSRGMEADILKVRGQLDDALRIRLEEELPVYERLGDARSKAVTQGRIADILQARGQLDEALRIRREEELPVYERLGDVREKAVTQGKIAGILQERGRLDEALRIHQEEQLPVYERLGDVRGKAVTQGQIADILQLRGQLDAALRIRQEEQLPVYERLGDVREMAITQAKIADILQARGQLDEAQRILREEVLPLFDRLGDVRSKAVTQGQIADILQDRGRLDEALRIRQEEQLPIYEHLGDVRSKAIAQGGIADILQARGRLDEALRIRREEELPVYERQGDARSKAITQGKIAHILQGQGQLDEALSILREGLPVYERLGDVRERVVCQTNIALILLARGQSEDRDEIVRLLAEARAAAEGLRIPEAEQIRAIQRQLGLEGA